MQHIRLRLFQTIAICGISAICLAGNWGHRIEAADKLAARKCYYHASLKYEHILNQKGLPADSIAAIKTRLADCYLRTGRNLNAEANYAEVVKTGKADARTIFNYARALEADAKYNEAKDWFEKCEDAPALKDKKVKGFIKICENAAKGSKSDKYSINRTLFNTFAAEFAPAYYRKGLAFTSNRKNCSHSWLKLNRNSKCHSSIYTVQEDYKGDLKVIEKLPARLRSKLNDQAACFSAEGDDLFFTRCDKHKKCNGELRILHSNWNGKRWNRPQLLTFETAGSTYAFPALSPDGNYLYFSGNISGNGQGGMDLYVSHKNGSIWETPVNLGDGINTGGNETFPFVSADGTLFFTSDGWPGYGGTDIFRVKMKDGKFAKVENMGVDFNSPKNDLSLIYDSKNHTGYFASNRAGDKDIYAFKMPVLKTEEKEQEKEQERPSAKNVSNTGKILDQTTGAGVEGARVEIFRGNDPMGGFFCYSDANGMFYYPDKIGANDRIRISKENYQAFSLDGSKVTDPSALNLSLVPQAEAGKVRLNAVTLYYEVNRSALTENDLESLRPVIDDLKSAPNHVVYVSGFADERGNDIYNYGLSLRRVQQVIDYLSSQGVDMLRIRSAYFGGVKLSEKCRKNPRCIAETDRENRRVEVYITVQ